MTQPLTATTANVELAAIVGIDWADQKHAVCLRSADASRCEHSTLEHTPEALTEWVAQLRARFGGRPVGICLEQTRGALLYALMVHDFLVLYPIHPTSAKRYRDTFAPCGAKDDPVDAHLLADFLCKHREQLRPWHPDEAPTRQLALLCEHRRQMVNERTKLVQQLTAALKAYFPQALDWAGESLATPMACDFLQRWPTLAHLQKAKPHTLRKFYYAHHCRRLDRISEWLAQIPTAQSLTTDPAVVNAYALLAVTLARQLRSLLPSIAAYDQQIQALFATHPDAPLFLSFPGAGDCLAPRLAAAFGTDRTRFANAAAIQQLSGVAPVTRRSGKSCRVSRRLACAKFLLQTFHEFAGCSIKLCAWAQAYDESRRAAGKGHHAAVRALAFKWIRILWRCWQDRTPYDEQRYLGSLHRHGSPLTSKLPQPILATHV